MKTAGSGDLSVAAHNIRQAYCHVARVSPNLDLRFIFPTSTPSHSLPTLHHKVGVVMSHIVPFSALGKKTSYQLLSQRVSVTSDDLSQMFHPLSSVGDDEGVEYSASQLPPLAGFDHVALGGTFDHIHMGHRLLLTESLLLARKRLLVGVADGYLLERKVLPELIAAVEQRVEGVRAFLEDVKCDIHHQVVCLLCVCTSQYILAVFLRRCQSLTHLVQPPGMINSNVWWLLWIQQGAGKRLTRREIERLESQI